ncbi:MAG: hypothetical protein ACFFC6_12455, partial [Promethearchaeota archaeon]
VVFFLILLCYGFLIFNYPKSYDIESSKSLINQKRVEPVSKTITNLQDNNEWIEDKQIDLASASSGGYPSLVRTRSNMLYSVSRDFRTGTLGGHTNLYTMIYIYKSIDHGQNWDKTEHGLQTPGPVTCIDMAVDIYNDNLYVVLQTLQSTATEIYLWRVMEDEVVQITFGGVNMNPAIAIDCMVSAYNNIYITYEHYTTEDDREMYVVRSQDHGETFHLWHRRLSGPGGDNEYVYTTPDIATDKFGNVYVTYAAGEDSYSLEDIYVESGSRDSTVITFESQKRVFDGDPSHRVIHPNIAISQHSQESARIVVAFEYAETPSNHDIYAVYSTNNGTNWFWTTVQATLINEQDPAIAVDGNNDIRDVLGTFYVVYMTGRETDPLSSWQINRAPYTDLHNWVLLHNYTMPQYIDIRIHSNGPRNTFGISSQEVGETWYPIVSYWTSIYHMCAGMRNGSLALLPSPILLEPENETYTEDGEITFTWNSVLKAEMYELGIQNLTLGESIPIRSKLDFDPTIIEMIPIDKYTFWLSFFTKNPTITLNLMDGSCQWKVRANDSYGYWGNWSECRTIDVNATTSTRPTQVVLLSPNDSSVISYNTPWLKWEPLPNTSYYQVQISETPYITKTSILQEVFTTNKDFIASFLENGTYYWRVRAEIGDLIGPWSATWSFRVESQFTNVESVSTPGFDLITCMVILILPFLKSKYRRRPFPFAAKKM